MKKVLCITALIAALMLLTGSAFSQSLAIHSMGASGAHHNPNPNAKPSYCKPCLFYGGDWNSDSADWVIWADADGAGFGGLVQEFSPFKVPAGQTWSVTGLFANIGFINIDKMDPAKPEFSINKKVKEGSGGTVVKSGQKKGTNVATGRTANSGAGPVVEYTVMLKGLTVSLKAGTYWEAVVPPCNNPNDSACSSALYYESDTFDDTETTQGDLHFGPKEPADLSFINGPPFGIVFDNLQNQCAAAGYLPIACRWLSAGVLGTK